jgi:predicted alpha/beta-fold hydrolase
MYLQGDIATVSSYLVGSLSRRPLREIPWRSAIEASPYGPAAITGVHTPAEGATELALMIHGLGGSAASHYLPTAARAFHEHGISVLRIAQRGAARDGEDLHHAGLWEDLAHVLSDPLVQQYPRVYVVGFSMGGHVALHLARRRFPHLGGVVAICSPLFLDAAVDHMDRWRMAIYRRHVLRGLKSLYRAIAVRRSLPISADEVDRARTLRAWDSLTVVPRFGFRDAKHYYDSQSMGLRLGEIETRSLLLYSRHDPMVPPATLRGAEEIIARSSRSNARLVWFDGGGHVTFPSRLDLGFAAARRPYPQIIRWLRAGDTGHGSFVGDGPGPVHFQRARAR